MSKYGQLISAARKTDNKNTRKPEAGCKPKYQGVRRTPPPLGCGVQTSRHNSDRRYH